MLYIEEIDVRGKVLLGASTIALYTYSNMVNNEQLLVNVPGKDCLQIL